MGEEWRLGRNIFRRILARLSAISIKKDVNRNTLWGYGLDLNGLWQGQVV